MGNRDKGELVLSFACEGETLEIALSEAGAPRTAAKLLAALPARVDLHCAKIAGNHILWHAPFVEALEAAADVMTMGPGAFIYWPERQFLELIFGELQAETASVTVLGRMRGDVAPLRRIGERVAGGQGHRVVWADITMEGEGRRCEPATQARASAPLRALREKRLVLWAGAPPEIDALMRRRGPMLPAGPLLMAESEARKLHEILWLALGESRADPGAAMAAVLALRGAASRLDGFCGLHDAGGTLLEAAAYLESVPADARHVIEELILYAGRLAGWLDLRIPWRAVNEAVLEAHAEWPAEDG
jgi:hypothetical protein